MPEEDEANQPEAGRVSWPGLGREGPAELQPSSQAVAGHPGDVEEHLHPLGGPVPRDAPAAVTAAFNGQPHNGTALDAAGNSPLHWAALKGHVALVKSMLGRSGTAASGPSADARAANHQGCTALHAAAVAGQVAVIEVLLAADPSLARLRDLRGNSPLHTAVLSGSVDTVHTLVKGGCAVDTLNQLAETPLVMAVNLAQPDKLGVVDALLEGGACPHKRLYWAAQHGHHQVVAELLAAGAPPDEPDEAGQTPLIKAALHGHANCVEALARAGADVRRPSPAAAAETDAEAAAALAAALMAAVAGGPAADEAAAVTEGSSLWSPLLLAAHRGHGAALAALLAAGADAEEQGPQQESPLILAAAGGHTAAVQVLLHEGAPLNATDASGDTALHKAARGGHLACCECLVAAHAQLDIRNAAGATAYVEALNAQQTAVAACLKAAGADPNHQLLWAAHSGAVAVVRDLVMSHTVPINQEDAHGCTALHAASKTGKVQAMRLLLEAHAAVDQPDDSGTTPLISAAANGHAEAVRLLLSHKASIKALNAQGRTALLEAAFNGHLEAVKLLLEHIRTQLPKEGPQPPVMPDSLRTFVRARRAREEQERAQRAQHERDQPDGAAPTPSGSASPTRDVRFASDVSSAANSIHWASLPSRLTMGVTMTEQCVQALLTARQSGRLTEAEDPAQLPLCAPGIINAQDFDGLTAILAAAAKGHTQIAHELLAAGADIHRTDEDGNSALHLASKLGHWEIVRSLLAHGAAIKHRNKLGHTPLHMACSGGHLQVVKYLLTAGADVNAQDKDGWSALHFAAFGGHSEVMEYLVAKGADPHARTIKGSTILYVACKGNSMPGVLACLKAGVDVNQQQVTGYTALHSAALHGTSAMVKTLVAAGANVNAESAHSAAPIHYAADRGIMDMVQALLDGGALIDELDYKEATPLHYVIQAGREELVGRLLDAGANVNSRETAEGNVPLHLAAKHGQVGILALLLLRGADILLRNKSGFTALHMAAQYGQLDMVKELLKHPCADQLSITESGRSLIHVAAAFGQVAVARYLLSESGLDANQPCMPDPGTHPALEVALCGSQHLEVEGATMTSTGRKLGSASSAASWPITANAMLPLPSAKDLIYVEFQVLEGDVHGDYSIGLAPNNGRYDYHPGSYPGSYGYLASNGCTMCGSLQSLEQYGPKWGRGDVVGLLLNRRYRTLSFTRNGVHLGVAARSVDLSGPVFATVGFGKAGATIVANDGLSQPLCFNMDDLMVEEERRHNLGSNEPWSFKEKVLPVHLAAACTGTQGSLEMLRLLLDAGATEDHKDADGWTPLHFAALKGWEEGIRLLLQRGAPVNAHTHHHTTPLMMAVKRSHTQAARVLLEHGADCKVLDKERRTLLMLAASTGNLELIELLIDKGISIKAKDAHGRRAMQYASNERVVSFLEAALNRILIYREVFEINLQVEVRQGAEGTVLMAKHIPTSQAVAIKFHKHRENRDQSAQVLMQLSRKFVAGIPPGLKEHALFEDHKKHPEAPYAMVFDGGDKDLDQILSEQGNTPLPENQIRFIYESMVTCVHHMHTLDLVHHDLKARNFVRFYDGRYRLIDFDNTRFHARQDMGLTTIEICPPEVAGALLRNEKLRSSTSMDIWALGCVLYQMMAQTLLLADLHWGGDAKEGLEILAGLTQEKVDTLLERTFASRRSNKLVKHASSLLEHMLKVSPRERFTINEVASHSFLAGGNTATMDEETLAGIRGQLVEINGKVDSVLAHVVTISERTLQLAELPKQLQAGLADIKTRINGVRSLVVEAHAKAESPSTFVIAPELPLRDALSLGSEGSAQAVTGWLEDLKGVFTGDLSMGSIVNRLAKKKFRLRLVCEGCFQPVGDGYVVEQPAEWVAKILPALQVSFQMARVYNVAASLGRLVLPMLPVVPDDVMDKCQGLINGLKPKSSAEDFACIQAEVDKSASSDDPDLQPKQQVGAGLRQLARFLEKMDPSRTWGGLALVHVDPEEPEPGKQAKEGGEGAGDQQGKPGPKASSILWVCPACIAGGCKHGGPSGGSGGDTDGKKGASGKASRAAAKGAVSDKPGAGSSRGTRPAVVEPGGGGLLSMCFGGSARVHPMLDED